MEKRTDCVVNSSQRVCSKLGKVILLFWVVTALIVAPVRAVGLTPETSGSFDRYVHAVEARMDEDLQTNQFLVVDRLRDSRRQRAYDQLQQGQIYIEELHAQEQGRAIRIQGGLIHDWAGVIFIPKATLMDVIGVLRDYDHHQEIYSPDIRRSKLIELNGNDSKIYFQLYHKSLVTVVLNAYFDVSDTPMGNARYQIASRSTHILEVADVGKLTEHDRPAGDNHGYMWRLYSYWRIEQKDGGVYVQNESVALSRTVPPLIAWLVNPLVKSVPRDILDHLLTDTRNAVLKAGT
jgi:hypothetical protein